MRSRIRLGVVGFSIALPLLTVSSASAQQPPSLGYAWPPVIRAGETREVKLGGYDFTPDMQVFLHEPALSITEQGVPGDFLITPPPYWFGLRADDPAQPIPREIPVTLTASPETPAGLVPWQVANANGGTTTAMLFVSRGEELIEQRSRDFPQELPALPVGVSGRLSRIAEVDRYTIRPEAGGLVTVDLMARRLGAAFYGALKVTDEAGRVLADEAAADGDDPAVTFVAEAGRTYTIHVNDIEYRGCAAFVYRLAVRRGPRIVTAFPAAIPPGQQSDVELVGYGIATGAPQLETWRTTLSPAATDPGTLWTHTVETPGGPAPCSINVIAQPDTLRTSAEPATLQLPQSLSARMQDGETAHQYQWQATKDAFYEVKVESRAVGGSLDVSVRVMAPDETVAVEIDDAPGTSDALARFQASQEGTYTAIVRDLSGRPLGPDAVYRIEVAATPPDYKLIVPQQVNLPLAGTFQIPVTVQRFGGFAGEIRLAVDGLPPGVTVDGDPLVPAGAAAFNLPLVCAADAHVTAAMINILGEAEQDGATLTRDATAPLTGNLSPQRIESTETKSILLAVTMPPPFDLQLVDRNSQRNVDRGTTYPALFNIVRDEGYTGEIELQMAAKQARHRQGIRGPIIKVPADQQSALYPCFMPEWLSTDITRRMVVIGVAPVTDPTGETRYVTRLADARITMILEGALLKLTAGDELRIVPAGSSFEIPFVVSRSPKLPESATVELIIPDELSATVEADPVVIGPETESGVLQVRSVPNELLLGPWNLTLRATALQDGQWPVVSETPIEISITDSE
ncbi:MAG: hypothetical protein DWQ34_18790 [Planctomycetota bacterium]|nr:MAG: hypothetical protein DWQ34_18790 [Planctomycetota bacterium]